MNTYILEIKQKGIIWIDKILEKNITYTKPGSISYLLYGKKPSEQSINIKIGHFGEFISKELIKLNSNLNVEVDHLIIKFYKTKKYLIKNNNEYSFFFEHEHTIDFEII